MNSVRFTHLVTGKPLKIYNKDSVVGHIGGMCKAQSMQNEVNCIFLLVDKIRDPIPVVESEEQIEALLGLNKEKPE